MAEPGDGGPGFSWFAIDVTSEHVEPGAFPWPEPEIIVSGGPVPDSSQMVHAGSMWLTDEFAGTYEFVARRRLTLIEQAVEATVQFAQAREDEVQVSLELSNFRVTVQRDDNDFLLLF